MFKKIGLLVPALTWMGFALSIVLAVIGWVFSFSAAHVTLDFVICVALLWGWFRISEYGPNVSLAHHLILVGYVLLGHLPYLLVRFFFF